MTFGAQKSLFRHFGVSLQKEEAISFLSRFSLFFFGVGAPKSIFFQACVGMPSGLYGMDNSLKGGNGEKRMENRMENRPELEAGKSTLWTNTGQDWNFQRASSAIGPYQFRGKFVWTNHWSMPFPGVICMDQWSWKFFKSFSLHWYWSIDGFSQWRGMAQKWLEMEKNGKFSRKSI